jgi:cytochrome c peroxidase
MVRLCEQVIALRVQCGMRIGHIPWCFLLACLHASAQEPSMVLGEVPEPAGNPVTEGKRILGKILFWDEQLSTDDSVACGTCHRPGHGGADARLATHPGPDQAFATGNETIGSPGIPLYGANRQLQEHPRFGFGAQVTRRASQSVLTAMYSEVMFWDGRGRDQLVDPLSGEVVLAAGAALEAQVLVPILSSTEMGNINRNWQQVTDKLALVTPLALAGNLPADIANALQGGADYPVLFSQAFGDPAITPVGIAMAIATYERTLVPDQSPFDLYIQGNLSAMSADQTAGWALFRDSVCSQCHVPPLFTDNGFARTGLRTRFDDNGLQVFTKDTADFGFFKIPSLRNVGLRKALTHVGWITDVQDAIDFYNAGTHDTGHVIFTDGLSSVADPANPGSTLRINQIDFFGDAPDQQALVVDFLSNALTDPRAAAEIFPFDRPALASERFSSATARTDAGSSTAIVTTRAIINGRLETATAFSRQDSISINQLIQVDPDDVGKPGALYVVVVHAGNVFMRDAGGAFRPWDGKAQTLMPTKSIDTLGGTESVSVVENLSGLKGDFRVFSGYGTGSGIVYGRAPYRFSVE